MTKMWIVPGTQGRYDDARSWIVMACPRQELADAWALKLQTAVDALCRRDPFSGDIVERGMETLGPVGGDPKSAWIAEDGRPTYDVIETELRENLPIPTLTWVRESLKNDAGEELPSERRSRCILPDNVNLVAYDLGDWYVVGPNNWQCRDIAKGKGPSLANAKLQAWAYYSRWKVWSDGESVPPWKRTSQASQ